MNNQNSKIIPTEVRTVVFQQKEQMERKKERKNEAVALFSNAMSGFPVNAIINKYGVNKTCFFQLWSNPKKKETSLQNEDSFPFVF